jgi:hypothetical protein
MKVVAILKKCLFILFCMLSLQGMAQKTYFDVLINLVPSSFHYGEANDGLKDFKKDLKGLQAGVSFQAGVTPNLSLVSEFYFMMKGGRLTEGNALTDLPTKTRLYTLELPALARVHLGNFYFNAGPSVAYNLSGRQIWEETESTPKETLKLLFDGSEGSYNRWDAGVQMGVGYEFKLKKGPSGTRPEVFPRISECNQRYGKKKPLPEFQHPDLQALEDESISKKIINCGEMADAVGHLSI